MVADISQRDGTNSNRPFKARVVTSRYMSSSSTSSLSSPSSSSCSSSSPVASTRNRRCPSPVVSRTGFTSMNPQKRSHSVERKHNEHQHQPSVHHHPISRIKYGGFINNGVVAPPVTSKLSASSFTSTRSLFVSFQGETFSLPVSKTKTCTPSTLNHTNPRKPTPERIRRNPSPLKVRKFDQSVDQTENLKLIDQHRWPGSRTRQVMTSINSLDIAPSIKEHKKLVIESESSSNEKVSFDYCNELLVLNPLDVYDDCSGFGVGRRMVQHSDSIESSPNSANSVLTTFLSSSDTESISSASNSSSAKNLPSQDCTKFVPVVDARKIVSPKVNLLKKNTARDNPISSPRRVAIRPTSPSKRLIVTPPTVYLSSKRIPGSSPLRMRSSIPDNVTSDKLSNNIPSRLSFSSGTGALGRGKMGASRNFDAHQLRLLYNLHLQWRYVNARSNAALYAQKLTSEKSIYTAWVATSELRCSVTLKKIQLHLLRHSMKLNYVLKGQMAYLEEWVHLERNHSKSVLGVVESIRACSLRLPIVCGAKVNIQNLKDAISSAVDVMQAMASSVCSLLSKVEDVNKLVVELANVSVLERALLNQCRDLLSTLSDMQVNDCSMRIQTLQLVRAYGKEG